MTDDEKCTTFLMRKESQSSGQLHDTVIIIFALYRLCNSSVIPVLVMYGVLVQ